MSPKMIQGTKKKFNTSASRSPTDRLLDWYRAEGRSLPWRAEESLSNPYRIWVSEIMLQQTTVAAVTPYYNDFLKRWPNVEKLAAANPDDVLAAWAGLGYYSRARNMMRCARIITNEHSGEFPRTAKALKDLPGIGVYTSAAIAAIAFGEPVAAIDGNVERVVTRLFALSGEPKKISPTIRGHVESLLPANKAGDFAQAMMELGAMVCRPKAPKCDKCPLGTICQAAALGCQADYPKRPRPKERPLRSGTVYVLTHGSQVQLVRRPEEGLLGGMLAFPSNVWREGRDRSLDEAPAIGRWRVEGDRVRHTFTHFHLSLDVARLDISSQNERPPGLWTEVDQLGEAGLPSVMRKVAQLAFG